VTFWICYFSFLVTAERSGILKIFYPVWKTYLASVSINARNLYPYLVWEIKQGDIPLIYILLVIFKILLREDSKGKLGKDGKAFTYCFICAYIYIYICVCVCVYSQNICRQKNWLQRDAYHLQNGIVKENVSS
jgi:hypothetical protein